ncbi:MAG: aspartyl protease family protein [Planctomycetota bacterium]
MLPLLLTLLLQGSTTLTPAQEPGEDGWVPFERFSDRFILLEGTVSGHSVTGILDSGAAVTVFDETFARAHDFEEGTRGQALGVGGMQEMWMTGPHTVSLPHLASLDLTAAVIDLKAIQEAFGRKVEVIYGREFFAKHVIEVDYPGSRIRFHPSDHDATADDVAWSRMMSERGLMQVFCRIEGGNRVRANLDTGSGAVIDVFAPYVKKAGLLQDRRLSNSVAMGVGGEVEVAIATLETFSLGGITSMDLPAELHEVAVGAFANTQASANLGGGFFRRFHLIFDLPHQRFGIRGDIHGKDFARDRSGLRLSPEGDALLVRFVAKGSPAAKEGWKKGERIVAVDGVAVKDLPDPRSWREGLPGRVIKLTVEGEKKARLLLLTDYF